MNDPKWRFSLQALFVATSAVAIAAALVHYTTVNLPLCGLVFGAFILAALMYLLLRVPTALTSVVLVRSAPGRKQYSTVKCLPHQSTGLPDPTVSAGLGHL